MSEDHRHVRRLNDGRILVSYSTQEPDGTLLDGSVTISPGDPAYASWCTEIIRRENYTNAHDDSRDYQPIDYENLAMYPEQPDEKERAPW
ncbi:hypothetical protein [Nocardia sp. NBC_00511]|uniref:hypothetical protein n=1 Tax=Nocardia sp. NBC_00511 TaxID=2903591 RepID=UPI002F90ED85